MTRALWTILAAAAVLWPARLAGPLDGVPLDHSLEAVAIGLLLPWLVLTDARWLARPAVRVLIVALLVWKAGTSAVLVQDGWCLRFESATPLYRGDVHVPHSWDVRADWREPVPRCSAVMSRGYEVLERFPAWFYNLPPAETGRRATSADRPPNVTTTFSVDGYLDAERPGILSVARGEHVRMQLSVDDRRLDDAAIASGVTLGTGLHHVVMDGDLVGSHWSLQPRWNGRDVWQAAPATVDPPSALDRSIRPWGRFVAPALIAALVWLGFVSLARRVHGAHALAGIAVLSLVFAGVALSGRESAMRAAPLLLALPALVTPPRHMRNVFGVSLLIVLPVLAMVAVIGAPQAGIFTWYSSGDDWWMFQRFAYRIFMEGYWLEGGEPTFWFQPLYRWIAGSLHMAFGDSSVGELFWDVGAVLTGGVFAFRVARAFAGFRWGVAAAALTLSTFTLGPAWYLLGRGLSEFSSAGLVYGAALVALRARRGSWPLAIAAGALAVLSVYARLNNLPIAGAVATFALPVRQPIGDLVRPGRWWSQASGVVLAGVMGTIAVGLCLFTARTYYYTGVPSMLLGTQAGLLSLWQGTTGVSDRLQALTSSVLMVLTLNDPPRFDVRALPVLAGAGAAVLGLVRAGACARLPMNAVLLCLAGQSSALVARGSAYSGRFSIHLIPVAVTLAVCTTATLVERWPPMRRLPRVRTQPT